jgi:predicted ABC-type transport system involved in lysophospholipase L1 biosynthesis ATPase subunit
MKYAILGPQGRINRISDTEPQNVAEGRTVVELTDEQAAIVEEGKSATPSTLYLLIEGELKTQVEAAQIRRAERLADLPTSEKIKLAEKHIASHFTSFGLMEGLKKLMQAQLADNLESIPKTVAVATWVETVKQMALAGEVAFPAPPYTFDEIVAE